jgi:hypothetical protein
MIETMLRRRNNTTENLPLERYTGVICCNVETSRLVLTFYVLYLEFSPLG